jgi:hypothetical protein
LSEQVRAQVVDGLARAADPDAQREVLQGLACSVAGGKTLEHLYWYEEARRVVPAQAAAELAEVAIAHEDFSALDVATHLIETTQDPAAHATLSDLATRYGSRLPRLYDAVDRVARRAATHQLLAQAPENLGDAAAWFLGSSEGAP